MFENLINSPTNAGMQYTYKEKKSVEIHHKKVTIISSVLSAFPSPIITSKMYRKLLCIYSGSK